ncbi:MAG: GldG family protein [Oscillospiraceae bacterium]|jgi:hypothetical protein|nr:GldG family protein [Oscillospiraceae bacterium]
MAKKDKLPLTAEDFIETEDGMSVENSSAGDTDKILDAPVNFVRKLKFGSFSVAVTALFIIAVIFVVGIATVLEKVYPIRLDFTSDKRYSISKENSDYIKTVGKDITVTVLCTEENYVGGYYYSYLQYSQGVSGSDANTYFQQAVDLLNQYHQYNSNIKIRFVDPQDAGAEIVAEKPSVGDFLVESGEEGNVRRRLLTFSDLYVVETDQNSYYGESYITGSNVETAVTSAVFYVVSDKTDQIAVITAYNGDPMSDIRTNLEKNNYEFTEVTNLLTETIPEEASALIIAAPDSDYTRDEIQKVKDFLDNGRQLGKTLYFFTRGGRTPGANLSAFLAEWGFEILPGTIYEQDANYRLIEQYALADGFVAQGAGYQYTQKYDSGGSYYIVSKAAPVRMLFTEQGGYTTAQIVKSRGTSAVKPLNAATDWAAPTDESEEYSILSVSETSTYDNDNYKTLTSRIVVGASIDMFTSAVTSAYNTCNLDALTAMMNTYVGRAEDSMQFEQKSISAVTFSPPTELGAVWIAIVFMALIPILIIGAAIGVYIRRKRL